MKSHTKQNKHSSLIFTCEHGGNQVPRELQKYFSTARQILNSHRGWDYGALEVAKNIQHELNAPLFYSQVSRLVVDLNRSPNHPSLFSQFTKHLSESEKTNILSRYYAPYHQSVEDAVRSVAKKKTSVYHLSLHSFTPVLDGKVRNAEIGLLYDPKKENEKEFCNALKRSLNFTFPDLRVRYNYPYRGTSDGLTKVLRSKLSEQSYRGIEIEFNQDLLKKIKKNSTTKVFSKHLAWAIEAALAN